MASGRNVKRVKQIAMSCSLNIIYFYSEACDFLRFESIPEHSSN